MAQEENKYLGESGLKKLIEMIKAGFAKITHSHTLSEITDYTVDSEIKSDSENPVQNKVIKFALDEKVPITRTVNGKSLDADIDLNASDVGAANYTHIHDDRYYTETEIDAKLDNKSDASHNHNSDYDAKGSASAVQTNLNTVSDTLDSHIDDSKVHVTETEKATWNSKSNFSGDYNDLTNKPTISASAIGLGNVDNTSDANKPVSTAQQAAIDTTLTSAKSYTDTKTNGMATTTVVDTKISTHNTNTSAHSDIRELITGLTTRLNTLADSDDTTLDQMSEIVTYIKSNKSLIDSITTSKINVSDIVNNLTTNVSNKPLSAAQGVAIKALIDALQTAVNGKSDSGHTHDNRYYTESEINTKLDTKADKSHGNHVPTTETANNAKFLRNDNTWQTVTPENIGAAASSHGTHVDYSTTAPVMDGTASVGSASTVARSDHKHPTDTSRASKTEFDTHTADTTKHITSTERTNWNSAKTHADSAHAPSDAQKNQNAFSNIKVGSTTIVADNVTDTLELVGSNVTITPDATNDKVTIAVADGTTSVKGIVKLTNSTSSTSTETAATPSSVKSAYDLANQAKTAATNAQTKADSAYNLANSKVDSLSDLGITATATELNKLDGVTVTAEELNFIDGVTSNVQTQLNSKATIVELTKAEYDALGDVVNTDGKTYFITDADSILFSSEGTVLNVSLDNWVAKSNGTYTNTINVTGITSNDMCDINLYGAVTEEQARAYDELVDYIETKDGQVILTASEEITVSFNILLRGKVNLENKNVHIVQELNAGLMEYDNTTSKLEATDLQNAVDEIVRTMFDKIYPVGSVYTSVNNTNPSTIFGGTWEQIKDTFLLAAGNTYAGGSVGGEATHTLTVNEIAKHSHPLLAWTGGSSDTGSYSSKVINDTGTGWTDATSGAKLYHEWKYGGVFQTFGTYDGQQGTGDPIGSSKFVGGSQAHNNMPPYLTVFVWKRVA